MRCIPAAFFLLLSCAVSAQKDNPRYLSIGYQFGVADIHFKTLSEIYSPSYPYLSFEGFISRQCYFKLDLTSILILGSRTYIKPTLFTSGLHNISYPYISDLFSPAQAHFGSIQMGRCASIMPLGIDLNGLALNEILTTKMMLSAPIGYTPQLIFRPAHHCIYRLLYGVCFNMPGQYYYARIHKVEAQVQQTGNNKLLWQFGIYLQRRNFMVSENGGEVPASSHFAGVRIGVGFNRDKQER